MSAQIVNYLFEKYGNFSSESTSGEMEISVDVPGPFGQLQNTLPGYAPHRSVSMPCLKEIIS